MKSASTSKLTSMMKILLLLTMLAVVVDVTTSTTATVVDLSQPWTTSSSLYNQNKGYCEIEAAKVPCSTIGYVVVQGGEILAEGYTTGNSQDGKYDAWSVTKSWSTFLIGVLVDQGNLAITETLADIFDTDADWDGVLGAGDKKTITVEELLTMSSGLTPRACRPGVNQGQENLQAVLNHVDYNSNQRGQFNYLGQTHILSRIIERRAGATPRAFAESAGIFTKLGMTGNDFDWTTFGGVEGTAYGLQTNPRMLAKLGQLYLQGGLAATGDQLVSSSWVSTSITTAVTTQGGIGYGYQWYKTTKDDAGGMAVGADGQIIVFMPGKDAVVAIMAQGCGLGIAAQTSVTLLDTIANNMENLSVPQSSCSQSFSYWKYFTQHPKELLWAGLQAAMPFQHLLGTESDFHQF